MDKDVILNEILRSIMKGRICKYVQILFKSKRRKLIIKPLCLLR